jgi:cGMP-dependent protein kinase
MSSRLIRTLKKGDHFGEKSILLESTRTLDVIAKTNCILYSISIDTLISMVGDQYKDILYLNIIKMAFLKSNIFGKFNPKLIEIAYECFKVKNYLKGDTVLRSGHVMCSKIIIILEGSLINEKINQTIAKRGEILFENEVLNSHYNEKLKFDLVANPDCLLVEADKDIFMKFLGGSIKEIMKKSIALESLNKISIFRNFSQKKMDILSSITNIEKFDNGKRIIIQGETDSKFYIVKSGKVDIFIDNNYIRTLNTNEYFGERALFFKEPRTATAQANGNVECYVIYHKDFKLILEENLAKYLKSRFFLQDFSIELKDLDFVKELGNGNFGSVCLVKSRKNRHLYAIKSMSKKQIDHEVLHKNIELERMILLGIDHPFIVKLVKTLKDYKYIFFLMEYIPGKELFDVIRDIGLLDAHQTKFYACSMMSAIEYLHERLFIYRDLKPENIIVSENVKFFYFFFIFGFFLFFFLIK